jgi:D-arabinose 1-dehydrogenase-like Zn-dependent alcohol dehydrogenase
LEYAPDFIMLQAPKGSAIAGADPTHFVFKNLHIIGTMVGSMRDTDAALDFAARVCRLMMILSPIEADPMFGYRAC